MKARWRVAERGIEKEKDRQTEREGTLEKRVYRSGWSGTIGWHATTRFSWWLRSLCLSLSPSFLLSSATSSHLVLRLSLSDTPPASCAHRFFPRATGSLFLFDPTSRRYRCRSETPCALRTSPVPHPRETTRSPTSPTIFGRFYFVL